MAELAGVECIFHGSMFALELVGALQIAATVRSCRMQELVIWPVRSLESLEESSGRPLLPEEIWSPPAGAGERRRALYRGRGLPPDPQAPGLGLELDEEAVEAFRVPD